MKHITVFSIVDCFYFTLEGSTLKKPYILISIQDSIKGGFGFKFVPTQYCKDVLTLYFDDIDIPAPGMQLITPHMAKKIIEFVQKHEDIEDIYIHCLHGECRSMGTGAALAYIFNGKGSDEEFFRNRKPNRKVYRTILNQAADMGLL